MKKILFTVSILIVFLTVLSSVSNAQGKYGVVGKMFGKQEANTLFGKVNNSVSIKVKDLQAALDRTSDYVLIGIKNGRVILRNGNRMPISNEFENISSSFILYRFSKSMIQKLLLSASTSTTSNVSTLSATSTTSDVSTLSAASSASEVTVELRADVLTLSSSSETLEMSLGCPPYCQD
jgi:hypothetical protein